MLAVTVGHGDDLGADRDELAARTLLACPARRAYVSAIW
jgi:hypothetical protein